MCKAAVSAITSLVFNDPGMDAHLRGLYVSADWRQGTTTATLLATIHDYFADLKARVAPAAATAPTRPLPSTLPPIAAISDRIERRQMHASGAAASQDQAVLRLTCSHADRFPPAPFPPTHTLLGVRGRQLCEAPG